MTDLPRAWILALTLAVAPLAPAAAQEASISFGLLSQDTSLPVNIKADSFSVNNADGSAQFSGNVLVGQGPMRLATSELRVEYAPDSRAIRKLIATGGVTLASGKDAAESHEAEYTIDSGLVVMKGDVLLSQGPSVLSGDKLTINLKNGSGVMSGGVSTTFVPGGN